LAAWILADSLQGRYRVVGRIAATLVMLSIAILWLPRNWEVAAQIDEPPSRIIEVIHERVGSDETALVDDPGLAFDARRRTTYAGAALSQDAAESGQITGELLIEELIQGSVPVVVVDETPAGGDHLFSLRDYPRFHRFLEHNYELLEYGRLRHNTMAIWARDKDRTWQVEDSPDIQNWDGASFGDAISLLGFSYVEPSGLVGDGVKLILFWRADQPVEQNWKVFVHLVGPEGTIVSQNDKYPYDGLYPTYRWWPGQIVDDPYELSVPADAQPGDYQIAVGMYDELSEERIAVRAVDGHPVDDNRYFLPRPVSIE